MKRIILIGGMGPQASLELHQRLIQRAVNNGAVNGSDFPCIVHFSLPVDDFIADARKTKTALDLIITSLKGFEFQDEDTVVLACNTAHLLKDAIEEVFRIKITSLIDLTIEFIAARHDTVRLLASPTTIETGLYSDVLRRKGVHVLLPTAKQLKNVESTIRAIIASRPTKALRRSTTPVLLGCTELSCAYGNNQGTIDPMNILIDVIMPRKEML